ncbi:hypothetical protein LOK49_Contig593G00001 [Camellia lanceoleosa]|nr:hypothetical protein LOK49_Contig593G00001 [Camellia lanceoleosa]
MMMATTTLQLFQPPLPSTSSSNTSLQTLSLHSYLQLQSPSKCSVRHYCQKISSGRRRRSAAGVVFVGKEETQLRVPSAEDDQDEEEEEEEEDPSAEDLECISQIKRVLELLRKNRDMIFSERRRLIGIDDSETPTREDLADVLQEVNEGKIPKNRVALKMLADEMVQWPNLEGYGALYLITAFPVIIGISGANSLLQFTSVKKFPYHSDVYSLGLVHAKN